MDLRQIPFQEKKTTQPTGTLQGAPERGESKREREAEFTGVEMSKQDVRRMRSSWKTEMRR